MTGPATGNRASQRGWVSIGIAVVCVWTWIWQLALGAGFAERAAYAFGLVPAVLTGHGMLPPELSLILPPLTLVSGMFLHHGLVQLVLNIACLLWFGQAVERCMARRHFVIFVLACGVFAALLHAAVTPRATVPVLGMNGVVAGLLAACLLLQPRASVFIGTLRVPVVYAAGTWFVLNLGGLVPAGPLPAWPLLAGGAACGPILLLFLKRRDVLLFG